MMLKILCLAAIVGMIPFMCSCGLYKTDNKPSLTKFDRPQTAQAVSDWGRLKYGMFIHFGMSTYTGSEFDLGDQPSTAYAPTKLDVDQWIRIARDAGMKYAVLTSKHVSGHCLWDSKVMWKGHEYDYDVATSGNKTDVVGAFMAACKKYHIKPGLYWCMLDFRNNSVPQKSQWEAGKLPDDFYQLAQDQLEELMDRYPEIRHFWLDIPRAASMEQRTVLYNQIKKKKPDCIVLFNHGSLEPLGQLTISGFQAAWPTDVLNTERWPINPGWFESVQQWQGKSCLLGYEHCDTLCKNWFWVEGDNPREVRELYQLYKLITSNGGNLLLDVPPDRTGRIDDKCIQALIEMKKAIDDPSMFPDPVN